MNGWEAVAMDPCGVCLGLGRVIAHDLRRRAEPDLSGAILSTWVYDELVDVWHVVPTTEPAGEWLYCQSVSDPMHDGWGHSIGIRRII